MFSKHLKLASTVFSSIFILSSPGICEENPAVLEPIVVTAARTSTEFSQLLRSVEIIGTEEIENAPVYSVPGLLEHVLDLDVQTRGVYGIQADISIRGGTFEQTLILIDGIKVNDPQTGHHNMDLPLTLMDIERIEVLRGGGSSIYGANAFGGVVNIITKKPKGKKIKMEFAGGEHNLSSQALSLTHPLGKANNYLSFERRASSGYRPDTDFVVNTASLGSSIDFSAGVADFFFGFVDKNFGASSFYSADFPHEEEHTQTTFFRMGAKWEGDGVSIQPKLYWRKHRDKFILDRNNPSFYTNYHTTHLYGGEFFVRSSYPFGKLVLGGEVGREEIISTGEGFGSGLGKHFRLREAVLLEFEPNISENLIVNLGMRGDHYSQWGWQACPSFSAGYNISHSGKMRASVNRSFRIPTFTDLYYVSPGNVGSPNLTPEKAWSYEVGFDYGKKGIYWSTTLFRRKGRNLIDWIWRNARWEADNIGEVDTNGVELNFRLRPKEFRESLPIRLAYLKYAYLDSEVKNIISKYVLAHPRHQFCSGIEYFLPFGIFQTWSFSYTERFYGESYCLLDSKISKKIEKSKAIMEFFVEATNLLDVSYSKVEGVPLPGRWIQGGMKIEF